MENFDNPGLTPGCDTKELNRHYQKLDPRVIRSWKISRWIRLGITALLSVLPLVLGLQGVFGGFTIPVFTINGILLLYMLVTVFLYPAIEYRQWGYLIAEDRVEIRHGIFFIETTMIPVIRIQHVTTTQGPINRRLGISTILINTASGVFKIEGLSEKDAGIIMDSLKSKLLDRIRQQDREPARPSEAGVQQ